MPSPRHLSSSILGHLLWGHQSLQGHERVQPSFVLDSPERQPPRTAREAAPIPGTAGSPENEPLWRDTHPLLMSSTQTPAGEARAGAAAEAKTGRGRATWGPLGLIGAASIARRTLKYLSSLQLKSIFSPTHSWLN